MAPAVTAAGDASAGGSATARVRIESIGAGGDGVGHLPDGRVVFVPRSAPGDLIETRIAQSGRAWVRAFPVALLEPGPARREPPCPFADRCGGCALEHLEYPAQLDAKARIIADAVTRIGRLEIEPPHVTASPRTERYRNRATFGLRRLAGGRVVAGFRAWNVPDRIVDLDGTCQLFEEPIGLTWDALRASWGDGARLLPGGRELRLTLRATSEGAISLLVEHGAGKGAPDILLERVEGLRSVWVRGRDGVARHAAGERTLPDVREGVTVPLGGAAFTQVNREAAELLELHVDRVVGEPAGLSVVDAFAGVGLRARRLALRGASAAAIELDPDAVAAGRRISHDAGVEVIQGRVEEVLARVLPADVVILNPPRQGLDPSVPEVLRRIPPHRIVYVSCDPATLARDLSRLGESFRVGSVRGFDLFPQTAHVETVVRLDRAE